jgi:hypothetical protein
MRDTAALMPSWTTYWARQWQDAALLHKYWALMDETWDEADGV